MCVRVHMPGHRWHYAYGCLPSWFLWLQDDEEVGDDADNDKVTPQGSPTPKKGTLGPKLEADYGFFVDTMWMAITIKAERQTLTPALIWQVLLHPASGYCLVSAEHCLALSCADATHRRRKSAHFGRAVLKRWTVNMASSAWTNILR